MKGKIIKSLLLSVVAFVILTLSDLALDHSLTIVTFLDNAYLAISIFFSFLTYILIRFIRKRDWKLHDWVSFFFILYPVSVVSYLFVVFLIGYVAFDHDDALNVVKIVTRPLIISLILTIVLYYSYKNRQKAKMEGSGDAR